MSKIFCDSNVQFLKDRKVELTDSRVELTEVWTIGELRFEVRKFADDVEAFPFDVKTFVNDVCIQWEECLTENTVAQEIALQVAARREALNDIKNDTDN